MQRSIVLVSPGVEVRWGIEVPLFLALLGRSAKRLTAGHIRVRCTLLGGFEHDVEFYFTPSVAGHLRQIEIKRIPRRHRRRDFEQLQARLESQFGPGERAAVGLDDIAPCKWVVGQLHIEHNYYYRSGLYEQVLISHGAV
jgi:hypothetical protein